MNNYAEYLKLLYESGESLSERQWDKLYQKIRLEAIRDITMDELRENNPELYQEIAEDIMMSAFAGRADEVYSIVLPAINEMRKEIDDSMELLKRELSAIVDRNAKKKFAELLSEIEKATSYKNKWRQKELARMRAEEKQKNEAEKSSNNYSLPTNTWLTKRQSQAKRRSEKSDVEPKKRRKAVVHHEKIRIGDRVMCHEREVTVIDVINKYGIRKLVVKDQFGETFAITNYDIE